MEDLKRIETHNLVEMNKTALQEAIKKDFGLDLEIIDKVTIGYQSQVYKATLEGKTVFIKINEKPITCETEIWGYEKFKEKGIPTPYVIAYQERPGTIGHPTIIISEAVGNSLNAANLSPEQENKVYEKAGRVLKSVNEVEMEGYGPLVKVGENFRGSFNTYAEYFAYWQSKAQKGLDFLIANNWINAEEEIKIKNIIEMTGRLDIGKASLLHKDIHRAHIFVEDDEITSIIDMGGMLAGDPRFDIANSLVFQTPTQQEHFKKGYGPLADDPMVLNYLVIITIRKILFRMKVSKKDSAAELLISLHDILRKVT